MAPGGPRDRRRGRGAGLRGLAAACALALGLLGGCAGDAADEVTVLAAASLTEAFEAIEPLAREAGIEPRYSFGGSSALAEQAARGVPADVLVVADPDLVSAEAARFATNPLVLVVAGEARGEVQALADLARVDLRLAWGTRGVPAGDLARDLLAERGILEEVEDQVVTEEPDVKGVVAKVSLGEADAGFVYVTDARAHDLTVAGDPLPAAATYAAEVIDDAPNRTGARRFVDLLTTPAVAAVLETFGFEAG